jgi:sec-independent protein translocase protein TatC
MKQVKRHDTPPTLPTFLDHVHELRNRLFWSVGFIVAAASIAFAFKDDIISVLTAPLGDQALYYLTPAGGFSFIIKICTYAGSVVAIPFILYHIYRYLEPLMGRHKRPVWLYTFFSALLAATGVGFAYFVSLPAALHFLTNLDIGQIHAMLTADAYLSFVITYLLGAAILFQLPLLLLIINPIWPLPPKKLMRAMRFVIVGAFIVAAIISPTPDIINQALMALPIIGMYQIGVVCIWAQNRLKRKHQPAKQVMTIAPQPQSYENPPATTPRRPARRLSIDGILANPT